MDHSLILLSPHRCSKESFGIWKYTLKNEKLNYFFFTKFIYKTNFSKSTCATLSHGYKEYFSFATVTDRWEEDYFKELSHTPIQSTIQDVSLYVCNYVCGYVCLLLFKKKSCYARMVINPFFGRKFCLVTSFVE